MSRELSDYTFVSRYARYLPQKRRREIWEESVKRMMDMHREFYGESLDKTIDEIEKAVVDKRILGSQRALQFGGKGILDKHARQFNCASSYCDRLKFFQECFWLLLCGTGTGFSVQKHHIDSLPKFSKKRRKKEELGTTKYLIEDSIEGWADSLGVLLSSYFETDLPFPLFKDTNIDFDFSRIRKKGDLIKSSGAKAPGPEPLKLALEQIKNILEKAIDEGKEKLEPIDAYDIIMHFSDAVLAGGIRRSATVALFSLEDEKMMKAKTGDWFITNPQRGRSNNSVVLLRDKTTYEDFAKVAEYIKEFGEPGYVWVDDLNVTFNPCLEVSFYCYYFKNGKRYTGWNLCNLTEINGKKCKTEEDFYLACALASELGTIQAGYNKFPYLGEATEALTDHERLLGVSITGVMDNPQILLNPEILQRGAKIVLERNEELAKQLGINPAARCTLIKPSGTASCLLETASGIHPQHYTRYLRQVQSNKQDPVLNYFKLHNPNTIEESFWDPNKQTEVISFCIEVPDGAKTKNDVNALELLKQVKVVYENWVLPGTRQERCLLPCLTHNVSNTINIKPTEYDEVLGYIYENRHSFAGISMLPITGDKDYIQAPFQAVYTPREQVKHYGDGSLFASGIIEDLLREFDNLWIASECILGIRPYEEWDDNSNEPRDHTISYYSSKKQAVNRAIKFANKYFNGDIKKMTYCLKDVFNWKKWVDLKKENIPVDYSLMYEEDPDINFIRDTVVCAGGKCDI